MKKIYPVSDDFIDTRFDRWFKKKIFNIPQSNIEKNLRKGKIKVNNKKKKSSYKVQEHDQICVYNFSFITKKNKKNKSK